MGRRFLGVALAVLSIAWAPAAQAVGPVDRTQGAASFEYSGDLGPAYWGDIHPDNAPCGESPRQSPVDIDDVVIDRTLGPLDLNVSPVPIDLVNAHRTVDAAYVDGGTLVFGGETYDLLRVHFHTLSEHTVYGRRGVMELHAVFVSRAGEDLAVIGQLFRIGAENPFLAKFDDHLPPFDGDRYTSAEEINLLDGLKSTRRYYTYPGSLTTPPCLPIVTWIVLKEWATMSDEQFAAFRDVLGNDFRPLQPLNARSVRATAGRATRPHSPDSRRLPVAR